MKYARGMLTLCVLFAMLGLAYASKYNQPEHTVTKTTCSAGDSPHCKASDGWRTTTTTVVESSHTWLYILCAILLILSVPGIVIIEFSLWDRRNALEDKALRGLEE